MMEEIIYQLKCIREHLVHVSTSKATSESVAFDVDVLNGCISQLSKLYSAKPLEEWGEDYGDVLWWKFPIEEPPYVGSPLDERWAGYHTHWTPIVIPELLEEV